MEQTKKQAASERNNLASLESELTVAQSVAEKYDIGKLTEQMANVAIMRTYFDKMTNQLKIAKASWDKDAFKLKTLQQQTWMKDTEACKQCAFYDDATTVRNAFNAQFGEVKSLRDERANLQAKREEAKKTELDYNNCQKFLETVELTKRRIEQTKLTIERLDLQLERSVITLEEFDKKAEEIELAKQAKLLNLEVDRMIAEKQGEVDQLQRRINTTDHSIHSNTVQLSEDALKLDDAEKNLDKLQKLEEEFRHYSAYLKCVHREGIPYSIIISHIDIINKEVDSIMGDYVPFKIVFDVDYDKKLIPINIIYENGTSCPVEMTCGMERMVIAIAIRAAFASIMNIPHSNLFVVDESFGQLDKDWIGTIDRFLEHLKTMFEHILLISHIPDVQDYVDQTITVEKVDDFSRLHYV